MESIYTILSHPVRRKILLLLEAQGKLSYTDLLDKLTISSGKLNYHIKEMSELLEKDDKAYILSDSGYNALKLMNVSMKIMAGEEVSDVIPSASEEITRIGVVICRCNHEISDFIDVTELIRHLSRLKNVVSVLDFENICQERNLRFIKKWIQDNFINKVVIGACSPRTHHQIVNLTNQIKIDAFGIANIREQCAWVHRNDKQGATEKAKSLLEAEISKIRGRTTIPQKKNPVEKSIAVVGGGLAGITLSQYLAQMQLKVYLIERSPTLGGISSRWSRISGISDCATCVLNEEILELTGSKNVEIITNAEVTEISGNIGNFEVRIVKEPRFVDENECIGCLRCLEACPQVRKNEFEMGLGDRKVIHLPFPHCHPYVPLIYSDDIETCKECTLCADNCQSNAIDLEMKAFPIKITVGAIVFATGCDLYRDLSEWGYNPLNDVINTPELERILAGDGPTYGEILKISDKKKPKNIAIIQCVAKEKTCSHYCCDLAFKYLDEIKGKDPSIEVEIFYDKELMPDREILGMFSPSEEIRVTKNLQISINGRTKTVWASNEEKEFDMIVLNVGMIPSNDLHKLRRVVGFSVDENGYLREETLVSGCYACGSVTGPKTYHETVADAKDKAIQIASKLSEDYIITNEQGLAVDPEKCGLCGLCTLVCPYVALSLEEGEVKIDTFKCQGCGICIPICSSGAISFGFDTTSEVVNTLRILSKALIHPKIIAFCCSSCGYSAADHAGIKRLEYPVNVFVVEVPCAGRIDSVFLLKAFEYGFEVVNIFGCSDNVCKYFGGSKKAKEKVEILRKLVKDKRKKINFIPVSAVDGTKFAETINTTLEGILSE